MPGQRRNLELKAVDPDPPVTLHAALELGAEDQGVLRQRDTYFHAVTGHLKLREAPPQPAELISYTRADLAGPKVSHYRVEDLRAALGIADERLIARGYADLLQRSGIVIARP
jgi:hypothetical protein